MPNVRIEAVFFEVSRKHSPSAHRLADLWFLWHIPGFTEGTQECCGKMQIWPAIDLRGGKCVRLVQGDYDREVVFGDDPVAMARRWTDQGGRFLHLVDLDGARSGKPVNVDSIRAIVESVDVPCELGGGIRDESTIEMFLGLGIFRLIIGTKALKEPEWFRRMCRKYPDRLAVGIDALGGLVATDGWRETSETDALQWAGQFAAEPVSAIIYTDIATDGMLSGPNVEAQSQMRAAVDVPVIASGGITTVDDVARLAAVPMAGCIIGRALYEGSLKLPDALVAAAGSLRS